MAMLSDEERKRRKRERLRQWRAQNPDKVQAARQRAFAKDPEKHRARVMARQIANPEKAAAATRAWAEANPEKASECRRNSRQKRAAEIRAYDKAWREANPEKQAARAKAGKANRKARKLAVGGEVSAADLRLIHEMADGICAYCLKPCDEMHLEHCIPLVRGGANIPDNCVMACPSCNARKGSKTPLEFLCGLPKLGVAA